MPKGLSGAAADSRKACPVVRITRREPLPARHGISFDR
jgi:hypothetical protein